jgi:hypothetical protein
MPIPKPRSGEERKAFLSRCMGNKVMTREFPDNKQRYAVCNTSWRKKKMLGIIKEALSKVYKYVSRV